MHDKMFWLEFVGASGDVAINGEGEAVKVAGDPYSISILVVQYGFMLIEGDWEVYVLGVAGQAERFNFDGDEKDARYLLSLLDRARRSGWPVKYNVEDRTGEVEVMG